MVLGMGKERQRGMLVNIYVHPLVKLHKCAFPES